MTTRRQRLALRGAGASFAANLVAAVSHTLGGEAAPAPLLVVAMMAVLWAPSMALMGRRPRAGRIAATVIVAQVAFHSVYAALGFPSGDGALTGGRGGHHAHGVVDPGLVAAAGGIEVSALMVASHAVAAAVTFVLLMFGESTVRRILAWTIASVRARLGALPPRVRPRAGLGASAPRAPRGDRAFALIGPRGPPLPSL